MSKHKLIMENWRKFLSESDRGYRTTTPEGDDVYLYHERLGATGDYDKITLYTIDPDVFFVQPLNFQEMIEGYRGIGSIIVMGTNQPCIPTTDQVGSVHTTEEFERQGYGTLLYDLAFLLAGSRGRGLTSDRDTGTKTTARGIWDKIEANDTKYEKRKTRIVDLDDPEFTPEQNDMLRNAIGAPKDVQKVGGNDTFDYTGRTPDPDDDCKKVRYGGKNATNHSFILRDMGEIKGVYDELKNNHKELMKIINEQSPPTEDQMDKGKFDGGMANDFFDFIRRTSSDAFGDRYSDADE